MKAVCDFLFLLTPRERRRIPLWFEQFITQDKNVQANYFDDVYLYYIFLRSSLFVTFGSFLLNVASHVLSIKFDLYFFVIDLTGSAYVRDFLFSYTNYTATVLIFFIFPYYYKIRKYNYNRMRVMPRTVKPFLPPDIDGSKKFFLHFLTCFVLVVCLMYQAWGGFVWYMEPHHYEGSNIYFLVCGIVLAFLLATMNFILLIFVIGYEAIKKSNFLEH